MWDDGSFNLTRIKQKKNAHTFLTLPGIDTLRRDNRKLQ